MSDEVRILPAVHISPAAPSPLSEMYIESYPCPVSCPCGASVRHRLPAPRLSEKPFPAALQRYSIPPTWQKETRSSFPSPNTYPRPILTLFSPRPHRPSRQVLNSQSSSLCTSVPIRQPIPLLTLPLPSRNPASLPPLSFRNRPLLSLLSF